MNFDRVDWDVVERHSRVLLKWVANGSSLGGPRAFTTEELIASTVTALACVASLSERVQKLEAELAAAKAQWK